MTAQEIAEKYDNGLTENRVITECIINEAIEMCAEWVANNHGSSLAEDIRALKIQPQSESKKRVAGVVGKSRRLRQSRCTNW